jgi:hypothetical protein
MPHILIPTTIVAKNAIDQGMYSPVTPEEYKDMMIKVYKRDPIELPPHIRQIMAKYRNRWQGGFNEGIIAMSSSHLLTLFTVICMV